MNQSLPEYPIGDVDTGDVETGNFNFANMFHLVEHPIPGRSIIHFTAPTPRRTAIAPLTATHLAARVAAAAHQGVPLAPHHTFALHQLKMSAPAVYKHVMDTASIKAAARSNDVKYEVMEGGRILSASIGRDAELGHSEIEAFKSLTYQIPPFQPAVLPFAYSPTSGAWTLDLGVAANVDAGLANGTTMSYLGLIIVFAAAWIQEVEGLPITINRGMGAGGTTMSDLIELNAGTGRAQYVGLNGALVSGHPRLLTGVVVAVNGVAGDPFTQVSLVGVPSNYIPSARFFQPGDATFSALLQRM